MSFEHSDEKVVRDEDALWTLLDERMNANGVAPEVPFRDHVDRPGIAWLIESGGDDVWPMAVYLGGERAECPEIIETPWANLGYPLTVLLPSSLPSAPEETAYCQEHLTVTCRVEPGPTCRFTSAEPRVHNHPPYLPACNERSVDGQLRGACLNDDGSDRG